MINIVIPMAGRGSRFVQAGYSIPKPLIPIHGFPMIEVVIRNITPDRPHHFIFVCLNEHLEDMGMAETLKGISSNCSIIPINEVTEGAACTVLLAKNLINNEDQLMIANTDQWVDININEYINHIDDYDLDGLIMTMTANDPKWSYIGFDSNGNIDKVVEKQVISNEGTVGIYNFRKGNDFVFAAEKMIGKNLKVNGEFYVAPVYNELIADKRKLGYFNIGSENNGMYGLGTPNDLEKFLRNPVSKDATFFK